MTKFRNRSGPAEACEEEAGEGRFTVFTPTYNCAAKLHRVYESLCAQTVPPLEWIVVDDGSTDGTAALVEKWTREGRLPIRYFRQSNQGKHIAFNEGVAKARGEFFLCADADDRFRPDALERFLCHWMAIPENERPGFVGATCLCCDQDGKIVGTPFPQAVIDSNSAEIFYRYKARGEKWGFQRTEVLRAFPFPAVDLKDGYGIVGENLIWHRIATRYRTRYFNECLRVYYIESGSMMRTHRTPRAVARGFAEVQALILNMHWGYFRYAPWEFALCALRYGRFTIHTGDRMKQGLAALERRGARLLAAALWPLAFVVVWRDRWVKEI